MSLTRSTFFKWMASGAVAAAALLGASAASARGDVSWSVGINAPGIALGVAAPTYYAPPPVYYAPPPVYTAGVLPPGARVLRAAAGVLPSGARLLPRSRSSPRWLLPLSTAESGRPQGLA